MAQPTSPVDPAGVAGTISGRSNRGALTLTLTLTGTEAYDFAFVFAAPAAMTFWRRAGQITSSRLHSFPQRQDQYRHRLR